MGRRDAILRILEGTFGAEQLEIKSGPANRDRLERDIEIRKRLDNVLSQAIPSSHHYWRRIIAIGCMRRVERLHAFPKRFLASIERAGTV